MSNGGVAGAGGGGRAARALRLLLLLVVALAFVEYMSGTLLDSTTIRTYLSMPVYNATRPLTNPRTERPGPIWPKRTQIRPTGSSESDLKDVQLSTVNTTSLYNNTNANRTSNLRKDLPISTVNTTSLDNNSTSNGTSNSRNDVPISTLNTTSLYNNSKTNGTSNSSESEVPNVILPTTSYDNILRFIFNNTESSTVNLKLCPSPSDLGPITVNKKENLELSQVECQYPEVDRGGRYSPRDCRSKDKVAIVVPYRDRAQHLAIFLNHMHPFLMKQNIEYGIFIVEQKGNKAFNRAKLMNVGFMEAQRSRTGGYDCFIFHDIDLLPLDTRNLYTCPKQPRHMSVAIDKYHFKLPYADIFGGVSALTVGQFVAVNGFSNKYWGWGGEDDDMAHRIKKKHYHIARYPMSIARYTMLEHQQQSANPKRYQLLAQTNKVFPKDGLTSLEYEIVNITKHHLYTTILANIDEKS